MARNTVILIIRHAEKPEAGRDLSPEGEKHAEAYASFFKDFHVNNRPVAVSALFATSDTRGSWRPRLTLEPLSRALHLPIDSSFADLQTDALATLLKGDRFDGKCVVVCWKHGQILSLANALIGDAKLPPQAQWPDSWPDGEFSWILQVEFDGSGKLDRDRTYCIREPHLVGK